MKIVQTELPPGSALHALAVSYEPIDSFEMPLENAAGETSIEEIGKAFFRIRPPVWMMALFLIRNIAVAPFGLKTGLRGYLSRRSPAEFKFQPGERFGLFRFYSKTENEMILGENDKHLNFRVSLMLSPAADGGKKLTVSTVVMFNNWFGELYFMPVRPLHVLVVKAMMRKVARGLGVTPRGR